MRDIDLRTRAGVPGGGEHVPSVAFGGVAVLARWSPPARSRLAHPAR